MEKGVFFAYEKFASRMRDDAMILSEMARNKKEEQDEEETRYNFTGCFYGKYLCIHRVF